MKNKSIQVQDISIPRFGFGTYGLDDTEEAVRVALNAGYRHIDTADIYGSHHGVGAAVNKSKIPRDEIFITSKLWKDDMVKEAVALSVERFLQEMEIDYIDLLLIHRPVKEIPLEETLLEMDKLQKEGKVRALGVSNFDTALINEALKTPFQIVNNQIEYHPSHKTDELVEHCMDNDISVTAYSPLGEGKDLKLDEVRQLAEETGLGEAEVIIQWLLSKNMIVIPRSNEPSHIKENFKAFEKWLKNPHVKKEDL